MKKKNKLEVYDRVAHHNSLSTSFTLIDGMEEAEALAREKREKARQAKEVERFEQREPTYTLAEFEALMNATIETRVERNKAK